MFFPKGSWITLPPEYDGSDHKPGLQAPTIAHRFSVWRTDRRWMVQKGRPLEWQRSVTCKDKYLRQLDDQTQSKHTSKFTPIKIFSCLKTRFSGQIPEAVKSIHLWILLGLFQSSDSFGGLIGRIINDSPHAFLKCSNKTFMLPGFVRASDICWSLLTHRRSTRACCNLCLMASSSMAVLFSSANLQSQILQTASNTFFASTIMHVFQRLKNRSELARTKGLGLSSSKSDNLINS